MTDEKETLTLTLHGLPSFNKDVDGEVFARKFFKFMQALAVADTKVNGERKVKYLIDDLVKNTATARVRQQPLDDLSNYKSGVEYFQKGFEDIYYNRPSARYLPIRFVSYAKEIAAGTGEAFQVGEIKHGNDNIIRIDEGFRENSAKVLKDIKRISKGVVQPFSGKAHISLDGTILALDGRNEEDVAVLVLTAGGREVHCKVDLVSQKQLLACYKKRCTILGMGHYTGNDKLPDWVQIKKIEPVISGTSWSDWKASFSKIEESWAF